MLLGRPSMVETGRVRGRVARLDRGWPPPVAIPAAFRRPPFPLRSAAASAVLEWPGPVRSKPSRDDLAPPRGCRSSVPGLDPGLESRIAHALPGSRGARGRSEAAPPPFAAPPARLAPAL